MLAYQRFIHAQKIIHAQKTRAWVLQLTRCSQAHRRGHRPPAAGSKEVWLQTSDKATFLAALEGGGVSVFVFGPDPHQAALTEAWGALARFRALRLEAEGEGPAATAAAAAAAGFAAGALGGGGPLRDEQGLLVGEVVRVRGAADTRALEARVAALAAAAASGPAAGGGGGAAPPFTLVVDAQDWKVIPAENLVALAQPLARGGGSSTGGGGALRLLAAAGSAAEGRLMLEALQAGTAGVLLRTDDPEQVRELVRYVARRAAEEGAAGGGGSPALAYQAATVTAVTPLGMGDRACVDMACLLQPGEGLLVGSFARCLALVHSECGESEYIAARPFRVNAGPVHAYVAVPGAATRYLCELGSGAEVAVADPAGHVRSALVGRVKIERRPLVHVQLRTADGVEHSLMLQNAETVKLVGPACASDAAGAVAAGRREVVGGAGGRGRAQGPAPWRAVSVSALRPGDEVYVVLQAAARHTGIAIEEFIVEK